MSLNYLSKTGYGVWATLSSVLSWFYIFDIGIGNGLRNKYTELKATNDHIKIRYYVSTAYFIFTLFVIILIPIFLFVDNFIIWGELLNAPIEMYSDIQTTVYVVFFSLCVNFVSRLINTLLKADLKTALSDSFTVISHILSLIGIFYLTEVSTPSITSFSIVYTGTNILTVVLASVYFFRTRYKDYCPHFRYFKSEYAGELFSDGSKFFLLQLGSVILFQTSGVIISNLINPAAVADYNISQKYFSLTSFVFLTLSQPLWTGYGEAFHKQNFAWIELTFKRLNWLWLVMTLLLIFMIFLQPVIYSLWLGKFSNIDIVLSITLVVLQAVQMRTTIYETFINSTGQLRYLITASLIFIPLFIPLSILFISQFELGAPGLVLALILMTALPANVISTVQARKILNNASRDKL